MPAVAQANCRAPYYELPFHLRPQHRALTQAGFLSRAAADHLLFGDPLPVEAPLRKGEVGRPRLQRVVAAVSAMSGVHERHILGSRRFKFSVNARSVVIMALLSQGFSFCAIGRALGRDHSTIIYAKDEWERRAKRYPAMAEMLPRAIEAAA